MSDLFFGQTMTEAFRLISGGSAYTLDFNFPPDKVVVNNITQWTNTANNLPVSVWFRDETAAAEAYQWQVIDSAAAQSFNFLNPTTNGFTDVSEDAEAPSYRFLITGITAADPAVVTVASTVGLQSDQIIRITDLGSDMPTARGMDQLNNLRFKITVLNSTTFSLQDPITGEDIDSTNYTTYVTGGRITVESRVLTLNNPQVSPYSATNPYDPNPFIYNPATYSLTLGTEVIGDDGDRLFIEVYKFGQVTNLGDIG
jgi:hypothetical protein